METTKWIYDFPFYYKDLLFGKFRNYFQPLISTDYNPSKIVDGLYISDIATAFNKDELKNNEITHILTTVLGIEPMYPEDFVYMNIPTRDNTEEHLDFYLDECVDFIVDAIKNNGKILVHCSYGISRSSSIVIAYFIREYKYSYDQAYQFVKRKRSIIEPNDGFKKQLIVYSLQKNK